MKVAPVSFLFLLFLYVLPSESVVETYLTLADFTRAREILQQQSSSVSEKAVVFDDDILYRSDMFEGDIQLGETAPSRDQVSSKGASFNAPLENAITDAGKLWTSTRIPYTISSDFTTQERGMIAAAFLDFRQRTCLEFITRSRGTSYVSIIKGGGCWSSVGRTNSRQELSLHANCFTHGIIIHELLHAVGFWHEQGRRDRDEFVIINWANIKDNHEHNFDKLPADKIQHLDESYDYSSVMHYSAKAFSKNGRPTIVAKQANINIGQRKGFSSVDVIKVNKLYNCEGRTRPPPTSPPPPPPTSPPATNDIIRKPTRLWGHHWTDNITSTAEDCFWKCKRTPDCQASTWTDAQHMVHPTINCFFFHPGVRETYQTGFITYLKGKEKNMGDEENKRGWNHYAARSVKHPLECRWECVKERSVCGAASFTTWPLNDGPWKGLQQCWLFSYGEYTTNHENDGWYTWEFERP